MKGFNKVLLLGGLTKDPEVRFGQNGGSAYLRFSLACGYSTKDRSTGEWKDATDYVPCLAFGKVAEVIGKYCVKGSQLHVEGKVQTSKYQKDGRDVWDTHILVSGVILAGGKRRDDGQGSGGGYQAQAPQEGQAGGWGRDDFPMDFSEMDSGAEADIPF